MITILKARAHTQPPLDAEEKPVARALVAAARAVSATTPAGKILEALESRDPLAAVYVMNWEAAGEALLGTLPGQYYRTHRGAKDKARGQTRRALRKAYATGYSFGTPDPNSLNWAEKRAGQLILEWGITSQTALRELILGSMQEGMGLRELVKLIKGSGIGLTERYAKAVRRMHMRLSAEGFKGDKLEARVQRYADQLLRLRAETIARTEITAAQIGGAQAGWEQDIKDGLLNPETARQVWDATGGCEEICADLHETEAPIGGTFPGGLYGPPAHPNCRCGVNIRP